MKEQTPVSAATVCRGSRVFNLATVRTLQNGLPSVP
jgi:hypothetical protein